MDKIRKIRNDLLKLYDFCIPNELRSHKLLSIIALEMQGFFSLPLRRISLLFNEVREIHTAEYAKIMAQNFGVVYEAVK